MIRKGLLSSFLAAGLLATSAHADLIQSPLLQGTTPPSPLFGQVPPPVERYYDDDWITSDLTPPLPLASENMEGYQARLPGGGLVTCGNDKGLGISFGSISGYGVTTSSLRTGDYILVKTEKPLSDEVRIIDLNLGVGIAVDMKALRLRSLPARVARILEDNEVGDTLAISKQIGLSCKKLYLLSQMPEEEKAVVTSVIGEFPDIRPLPVHYESTGKNLTITFGNQEIDFEFERHPSKAVRFHLFPGASSLDVALRPSLQ